MKHRNLVEMETGADLPPSSTRNRPQYGRKLFKARLQSFTTPHFLAAPRLVIQGGCPEGPAWRARLLLQGRVCEKRQSTPHRPHKRGLVHGPFLPSDSAGAVFHHDGRKPHSGRKLRRLRQGDRGIEVVTGSPQPTDYLDKPKKTQILNRSVS